MFKSEKGNSGGLMNVIRCDEQEYLVWKWRPLGQVVNTTSRENAIRFGSSLRVKDGELAVFVYRQRNGVMQDFIYGPYDGAIKTINFPVLASIVGMAFGGESPFQADIYYINLAHIIKLNFAVPYFDVYDPRFLDFAVPVAVRGSISFKISDPELFIKTHRLIDFTIDRFKDEVRDAVTRRVKSVVTNVPENSKLPVVQIERKIQEINELALSNVVEDLKSFAVDVVRLDISHVEVNKESEGYRELRSVTIKQQKETIEAQTQAGIKNILDMQAINAQNLDESLRIQREETQRAQRLQTETQFIGAHALNRQSDVMQTAAQSMGTSGFGGGSGASGINPAQFMTGLAVGGALGGQMAGMVNNMGQTMNAQWQQAAAMQTTTPPPIPDAQPDVQYMLAINGQQSGPYTMPQLQQLVQTGQLTPATLVWTQNMPNWLPASQVASLAQLFTQGTPNVPPPIPPIPPIQ